MIHELRLRNIAFDSELSIPLEYKGLELETSLRVDLLIEKCIVVELKAVDVVKPVFHAQVMTYMKLLQVPKGILINFNSYNLFKEGQKTFINNYYASLPD